MRARSVLDEIVDDEDAPLEVRMGEPLFQNSCRLRSAVPPKSSSARWACRFHDSVAIATASMLAVTARVDDTA